MSAGVYIIKNIVNNKFYVGSSTNIKNRWNCHLRELLKNKHPNTHLQRSWNKYGNSNFKFQILEKCSPKQCLLREQFYIDNLNPEYNIYKVAGSPLGRIVSEETKTKISNTLKGNKLSSEIKEKISNSLKGKLKSKKHRNVIKSILWGKNGKLRLSKGGRFSGNYKFLNIKTDEEIVCGKFELSDKYNIDRSFVCKMCNNKIGQCKEWICLGKVI